MEKGFGNSVSRQKEILNEINSLSETLKNTQNDDEKKFLEAQIGNLKKMLKDSNQAGMEEVKKTSLAKPLAPTPPPAPAVPVKKEEAPKRGFFEKMESSGLEKETIKRLKKIPKGEKIEKEKKPSVYVAFANRAFSGYSNRITKKKWLKNLERSLVKSNLQFISANYFSVILLTTFLSFIVAIFVTLFFLMFNVTPELPIIVFAGEAIGTRFLKVFWILFLIPAVVFAFTYYYPSLEKRSLETHINQELPFAAIHMSSISGSLVEPSKIFSILISTKEYPHIGKEFTKIINEINIYGYNLVSALRNIATNSASAKLSELLNSLATTITSGGDIAMFFEKRAESLLFEHRLEREKSNKAAETFMDIYISVVIAAPMILMLLLMMMKISGLGIQLSTSMITLVMVLGVSTINIIFLVFLHLKQPAA